MAALRRLGLVKADEQLLTVHRLLQQVIRDRLDGGCGRPGGVGVRLLDQALPFGGYEDPGLCPTCARLLPHALAATQHPKSGLRSSLGPPAWVPTTQPQLTVAGISPR